MNSEEYLTLNVDGREYYFFTDDFEIIEKTDEKFDIGKFDHVSNSLGERHVEKQPCAIDVVGVNLVSGCNLGCRYCYLTASKRPIALLTERRFLEILSFLKEEKEKSLTMYFIGGGEPTLNFKLLKKIPILCASAGFKHINFELTTNGTNMGDEFFSFIKSWPIKLYISLDGGESANKSRVYKNGNASFDDIYRNLQKLRSANIDFKCKAVFQPGQISVLDSVKFFEEEKIKFAYDYAVASMDKNYQPEQSFLNNFSEEIGGMLSFYADKIKRGAVIYAENIVRDLRRIHYGLTTDVSCSVGIRGFTIDLDGKIYPCAMNSGNTDMSVGDIHNGVDKEKVIRDGFYARNVDELPICHHCWCRYLCGGGCQAVNRLINGNPEEPYEYMCDIQRIYWKNFIGFYIGLWQAGVFANESIFNKIKPL